MSLKLESLVQIVQTHLVLVALAQYTHLPYLMHASYCCILFGDDCTSVHSAVGSAPEEYREYPNEEQYQSTDPQGKQPTI